jgi:hypothetical protein
LKTVRCRTNLTPDESGDRLELSYIVFLKRRYSWA